MFFLVLPVSMLVLEFVRSVCVKLVAACSSAKGFQVETVAVDVREVCLGCWLVALLFFSFCLFCCPKMKAEFRVAPFLYLFRYSEGANIASRSPFLARKYCYVFPRYVVRK